MMTRWVASLALMTVGCVSDLEPGEVALPGQGQGEDGPPIQDDRGCVESPEICDGIDNDCNNVIDDVDADGDGHLIEECAATTTSPLPADDCNDADPTVFPGAPERVDGVDNDCDGDVDEGTEAFDDDGDCACEELPCEGSVSPACGELRGGDCDDADPSRYPTAVDEPDLFDLDDNCDGIDGTRSDLVFVDPEGGSDAQDGLAPESAVRTLAYARDVALREGRPWLALAGGTFDVEPADLAPGLHLAGGYAPQNGWARTATTTLEHPTSLRLRDWTTPTEWQQLGVRVLGESTSSIALHLRNVQDLTLTAVHLQAADGRDGLDGPPGAHGTQGASNATAGEDGCNTCDCDDTFGGSGAGDSLGGGDGGDGGAYFPTRAAEDGEDGGSPSGGSGGAGGQGASSGNGAPGVNGARGANGADGQGGAALGEFNVLGYQPASGAFGDRGDRGDGGGGGGGAAAHTGTFDGCSLFYNGAAGGGGGSGGLGGRGGGRGVGGGASVALYAHEGSTVTLVDSVLETGNGGRGGNGARGGRGGPGGQGAPGGRAAYNGSSGGTGGRGGNGGDGGHGGDGGGGGGGPTLGMVCRGGASVTWTSTVGLLGTPGPAGSPNGAAGHSAIEDGC